MAPAKAPIFVTGGSSGIGEALCRQLVSEDGCRVIMGAITQKEGLAAKQRLAKDNIYVDMVQIDVTNSENIFWAVQKVKKLL